MKLKRSIRRVFKRILTLLLVAGFFVLLIAAGQEQSSRFYREDLMVTINYDDGNYFISEGEIKNRINAWLERPISSYTISEVNLHEMEKILLENPYLQQADVYTDANGRLNISVQQRKPILRVINKQGVSYYLHENGGKMPVSNNFTPRVAVATGDILDNGKYAGPIESTDIAALNKLGRFIHRDPFMKGLVDQVIVKANGTYELVPKIENHTIWWGDGSNLEEKKRKLQLFYKKGIKKAGWKSYKRVDLRFKDQIVCKKDSGMDQQENIVVGLDIGTTKISVTVSRRNDYGKLEVLGMGKADSLGVLRGVVSNIDKTVDSIQKAVEEASNKSGFPIHEVYVGIAGQHIRSLQHRGILVRDNDEEEISKVDVDQLINDMHKLVLQPGEKIIHVLPQDFIVDHEQGIKEPIGMAGVRLEANFHIIAGQVNPIKNIFKCVEKAGLKVKDLILEPLASSSAVLSDEEKEAGVALVDIGGGTTDIAIFHDNIIRHTAVIPFGGNVVTEDIKEGCKIMRQQAEQLKIRFGSALAMEAQENEIVSIPGLRGQDPKEISLRNLAHIIQARMEEIVEHVFYEVKHSGFKNRLIGGIVLTGGGSKLKNLTQLVEYVTGMDARIGYPTEHLSKGFMEEIKHPMYATGIGLNIKGFEDQDEQVAKQKVKQKAGAANEEEQAEEENTDQKRKPKTRWYERLLNTGKKFFEEEDSEFK